MSLTQCNTTQTIPKIPNKAMTSSAIDHLDLTKLPVNEKTKLCAILDQNESWMQLAKLMMFPEFEIFVSMIQ